jgi:hypothetical protein
MRTVVLVIAAVITFSALAISIPRPASAATPAIAKLSITVEGEGGIASPHFTIQAILLPQVPIVLNVTFLNNETLGDLVDHTFTISDSNGARPINTGLVSPQNSSSVQFTVNSLTNITFNGTSFKPLDPGNGTIQYYCIPHQGQGMVGYILLGGTLTATTPDKGIVIRAYWIGIIAFVAMLVWVGISYYVIKSSSPHFKDQREHVRKGLP